MSETLQSQSSLHRSWTLVATSRSALFLLSALLLLGCSSELKGGDSSEASDAAGTKTDGGESGTGTSDETSSGSGGGSSSAGGGDGAGGSVDETGTGGAGEVEEPPVFVPPEKPQWTVDSLAALREAITQNDEEIVMKEGEYLLSDLPEGSRDLVFSGSNNSVDLVGVYVEVPVGSTLRQSYLEVTGSGNEILGGVFEDTYRSGLEEVTDYYAYNNDRDELAFGLGGDAVMRIAGSDNLIDGLKVTIRGSFPYGYGSIYGIGSGNTFGLNKRCGVVINGQDNILDHVEIQQQAFCHGIYSQSPADNTTVRNSLVEGVMRASSELYDEPEDSLPGRLGYMLPDPDNMKIAGSEPIPMDVMLPLSEDGLRAYTGGGSWTVENTTVRRMRGGIRLYLATEATVSNSTAVDCGATNFNLPTGATVTGSTGNFAFSTLNDNRLSRSRQSLELTILPSPHAVGPHNIADILGNSQNIVFHRAPGPLDDDEERAIVVAGNNSTIVNETEYRIIVTGSGNEIESAGEVTDNGSNNEVSEIPLEIVPLP